MTELKIFNSRRERIRRRQAAFKKLVPLLPQGTEAYGFPYPGFGGQSFGSKSSKSWYGTRFLKFNQSCMFSAVEHQKRCFSCSWMYIMQLTYILSRFPMPFLPLEPDAPLAFPTLVRATPCIFISVNYLILRSLVTVSSIPREKRYYNVCMKQYIYRSVFAELNHTLNETNTISAAWHDALGQ